MSCSMTHLYTSSSENHPLQPTSCSTAMSCLSSPPGDHRSITSRPKLTLQTTSLPRTFGSSTTGLSLSFAAGPTASPTVRNTFKNAYDVASPASATSSPSSTAPPSFRFNGNKPISPYVYHANNNPNTFSYRPYQLPIGVHSILRNSPLESASRRRSGSISAGTSGPGGAGARRVFFPAKKQVSYRNPLEEEIRTERYTAQHLDLFQDDESTEAVQDEAHPGPEEPTPASAEDDDDDSASLLSHSSSASSDDVSPNDSTNTPLSKTERKKRRTMRAERQVRAVALLDGFDTDPYASSTPQTPRQGRVKRRRDWKWTLGPVSTVSDDVQAELPVQIPAPQPVDPPPEKPPSK
ncbi:hypothetical protein PMG11_04906 [Penicillium brasilianum]|uniref:Uncharacterized protein n=1 Tax=Penicillium brasilianum TaxID=104259 RepID=A0A0F7VH34_PENBI|nr:hypothetical protein PMG11_04906 [Penicillium brasilianum]